MKTFIINSKSHFRHLWLLLFSLIVIPTSLYFLLISRDGKFDLNKAVIAGIIVFAVFVFPMILLHINYYLKSKGRSISYDESTGQLIYDDQRNEMKFGIKDLQKVTVYKSWPMGQGRTPMFPWDVYNYAVIELKDGQVLKISSLLVYEFDKVVKFENTEIKKTFYAWMS